MSMTLEQAKEKLAKYGQEHVLKYYGELNEEEKQGIAFSNMLEAYEALRS